MKSGPPIAAGAALGLGFGAGARRSPALSLLHVGLGQVNMPIDVQLNNGQAL
jgi:hypothetical protein